MRVIRRALPVLLLLLSGLAHAQVPRFLPYQGVLTDSAGNPRPDGQYRLRFSLYEGVTGGAAVWNELQTVRTKLGVFSVHLGDSTALSATFDKPYWLGITVLPSTTELLPRVRLGSTGYALSAARAESVSGQAIAAGSIDSSRISPYSVSGRNIDSTTGLLVRSGTFRDNVEIAGNLGVGVANPYSKIDVAVNSTSKTMGSDANIGLRVSNISTNDSSWVAIAFGDSSGRGTALIGLQSTNKADDYGDLVMATRGADGLRERVRVNSLGNVGVGVDPTIGKLQVGGSITSTATAGGALSAYNHTNISAVTLGWSSDTARIRVGGNDAGANNGLHIQGPGDYSLMRIMGNGQVGIGTTKPEAKLDIRGNLLMETGANPALYTGAAGSELSRYLMLFNSPTATSASGLKAGGVLISDTYAYANPGKNDLIVKGSVGIGTPTPHTGYKLDVNGHIRTTTWSSDSDRRLKTDITTLDSSLLKIQKLRATTFSWNRQLHPDRHFPEGPQIGMIAQEVEEVLPELVHTDANGYKSLSYDKLTAVLVEAVKELQAENRELRGRVEELEARVPAGHP